jgi:putative CocE/NonD family hydrolase
MILPIQLFLSMEYIAATDPNAEGWPLNDYLSPYAKKIPMYDGKKLATIVYDPQPVFDINRRGPTLLIRSPYNIAGDSSDYTALAMQQKFPGAFIVTQDLRGRFNSEGTDTLFGNDYLDGYNTIQWLKSNGYSDVWWYNGLIGSWGASALGINQYTYAGMNVPELRAQYISVASPMQYDHIFFQGGQFRYNMIMSWSTSQNSGNSAYNVITNPTPSSDYAKNVIAQHPVKDSWWEPRNLDINNRWVNVKQAAVHFGGWDDCFGEGTLNGFLGYSTYGDPSIRNKQVLIMGGVGHGFPVGDIAWQDYGAMDSPLGDWEDKLFNTELFLVNGARGSQSYENWWAAQQRVAYYVYSDPAYYGIDPKACSWRTGTTFPVDQTYSQNWYLLPGADQHSGILSLTAPTSTAEQAYLYNPANPCPTNGGNNLFADSFDNSNQKIGQGSTDQRGGGNGLPNIVTRSDVITFTSLAFDNAYEFTGNVRMRLFVKSNRQDTDFVGKLIDVFPDGREMLITDGILRACRRNGFDQTAWMDGSGSTIYELDVDIGSKAWRFQPGHKIKLLITSSNYPRFLRNPNKAVDIIPTSLPGDYLTVTNTIVMSPSHPSRVILPISDGWINPVPPQSNIIITSSVPTPSNSTSYTVKWTSQDIDSNGITIKLNGNTIVTGQAANNSITGYAINGLTPNALNNITLIGTYMGNPGAAQSSINIRTYCNAPQISMIKPLANDLYTTMTVAVNWTIDALNAGGLEKLWIQSDQSPELEEIGTYSMNYTYTANSQGPHWVNLIAKGMNGMYTNVNRSFWVDLEPPTVSITSSVPQFSPSLSYMVTWTNTKCEDFTVYLNGTQIGGIYTNASQSAQIDNLVGNRDNLITIQGRTISGYSVEASIIIHPYTGLPRLTNISPANGSKIWRSETRLAWSPNASDAGGIFSIQISSSSGVIASIDGSLNTYTIGGFNEGSQWVSFTVTGRNGLIYQAGINFTVDLSDNLAPILSLYAPNPLEVVAEPELEVHCTSIDLGGGSLESRWVEIRDRTGILVYNASFLADRFNITLSGEGEYNLTVFAKDHAWNVGSTQVKFYYDNTPPILENLTLPTNNIVNRVFPITYDLIEAVLANMTYRINTGTVVLLSDDIVNVTRSVSSLLDGAHSLTVFANDRAGYTATLQVAFILDTTAPVIRIFDFPDDGIWYSSNGSISLKIMLSDAQNSPKAQYRFASDEFTQVDLEGTSSSGFFIIQTQLEYGVHILCVQSLDLANNFANINFTITVRAPVMDDDSPIPLTVIYIAAGVIGGSIAVAFIVVHLKKRKENQAFMNIAKEEIKKTFDDI